MCQCGHDINQHCDGLSRCDGQSHDTDYGTYRCLCPAYIKEDQ